MYYTNENSLKATYGDAEAAGLLQENPGMSSEVRLDKAAATAYGEINAFLHSANYVTPFTFTPFGATVTPPDVEIPLHPVIQSISDCFTAFHLASSTDLNKRKYEECRAAGMAWLQSVLDGKLVLDTENVDPLSGPGNLVVLARPQVFNRFQLPERTIFPGPWGRRGR